MQFRIIEITETEKFQFLKIFKNGNTSVQHCIEDTYPGKFWNSTAPAGKKPRFAIIREPYERFMSGLIYDAENHKINIKDINFKKIFTTNEFHIRNRLFGNINHSSSQIPYLMNTGITHYIDLDDLDIFLKMHFNQTLNINKTEGKLTLDKQEIMKHLVVDYQVYNQIQNSPYLWKWQQGRIF